MEFNSPLAGNRLNSEKEPIRRYCRYVYEAGGLDCPGKMQAHVIDAKVVAARAILQIQESLDQKIFDKISSQNLSLVAFIQKTLSPIG